MTKEGRVSLKPSKFSAGKPKVSKEPDTRSDVRIFGRSSLHNFSKIVGAYARACGAGYDQTMRTLAWHAVEDGWADDRINRLVDLVNTAEDISIAEDDCCIDSVLEVARTFSPGEKSGSITIRVPNQAVKDGLGIQSKVSGIPLYLYVQLRIASRIVASGKVRLGKTGIVVDAALMRFDKWLNFRINQLEAATKIYEKVVEPERA